MEHNASVQVGLMPTVTDILPKLCSSNLQKQRSTESLPSSCSTQLLSFQNLLLPSLLLHVAFVASSFLLPL